VALYLVAVTRSLSPLQPRPLTKNQTSLCTGQPVGIWGERRDITTRYDNISRRPIHNLGQDTTPTPADNDAPDLRPRYGGYTLAAHSQEGTDPVAADQRPLPLEPGTCFILHIGINE